MTTYVYRDGKLVPKREAVPLVPVTHYIIPDLPDYESPIDGAVVHGRRGRRNDFTRTNTRAWEGREAEEKEAGRQRQYQEQRLDQSLDEAAGRAFYGLHPDLRRKLNGQ